jgi:hypothetical protein
MVGHFGDAPLTAMPSQRPTNVVRTDQWFSCTLRGQGMALSFGEERSNGTILQS